MEIDGSCLGGKSKSRGQRTESRPDLPAPRSKSRPREGVNATGPKLVKRKKKVKSENRPDQDVQIKEEIFVDQKAPETNEKPAEEKQEINPDPVRKIRKVKRKSKSLKAAAGELKPIKQDNESELLPDKIEPSAEPEVEKPADQQTVVEENQTIVSDSQNTAPEQNHFEDAPKPIKKIKKIKKKSKSVKKTAGELKLVDAEKIAPKCDEKTEGIQENTSEQISEQEPEQKSATEVESDKQLDEKLDNQEDKVAVKTGQEQQQDQKLESTDVEKPKRRKKVKSKKSLTDTSSQLSVEQPSISVNPISTDVVIEGKCDITEIAENNEKPADEEKCDKPEKPVNSESNIATAESSVKAKSKSRVRRVKKKVKSTKIELESVATDVVTMENAVDAVKENDANDGPLLSVAKKAVAKTTIPKTTDSVENAKTGVTEGLARSSSVTTDEKVLVLDQAAADEEHDGFHRGISTTQKIELPEMPGHIVLGGPNADEITETEVIDFDEADKMTNEDTKTPKFALDIQEDDIEEYLTVDLEDLTLETPAEQEEAIDAIDKDDTDDKDDKDDEDDAPAGRKHSRPDETPPANGDSDRVDGEPTKKTNKSGKRPTRNAPGAGTGLQPFPAPRSFIERQHTDEIKLASKTGSAHQLNVDVDQIVQKKNNICPCSIM